MSDTVLKPETESANSTLSSWQARLFAGRRGRQLRETLLAYLFLLPALLIIFTFGLFPLAFSLYQSTLRGLNKIVGTYDGFANYVRAIDNLAYVLGFWLAAIFIFLAGQRLLEIGKSAQKEGKNPWLWLVPAFLTATGLALFTRFVFTLLPEMLLIPDKVPRGQELTREFFLQSIAEVAALPTIRSSFGSSVIVLLVALLLWFVVRRLTPRSLKQSNYYAKLIEPCLLFIGAAVLTWVTWIEIQRAYAEALESGETLAIWSQLVTISAGFLLLILSWVIWRSASQRSSTTSTFLRLGAAVFLAVGAWVLIGELPRAIAEGNQDWWQGLRSTVFFAAGTIPLQFIISLTLATILFQNITGKTFFRMIYFLPYIAPLVGTAAVFRLIFSPRATAPVNSVLALLGFEPLRWLTEPTGIMQLIVGKSIELPTWLEGPSLALVVIILFNVWTYVGFDMVVFLAGLGNIPKELYEAAAIDGSGRWAQFRHITLPLLSPTIYFLMLLAVIGTFKAFNHVYVMGLEAALGTTDTASIVIFETFNRDSRYGYASALAILLLIIIIILTVINNRISRERVFYG